MSSCPSECDHSHCEDHDEEQYQLQQEFRQYASERVPGDFATWSEESQSQKLAELLAVFQEVKQAQFDAEAKLEQSLAYIRENLAKSLPQKFQVLYDPQYWLDSVERPVRRAIKALQQQDAALTVVSDMGSAPQHSTPTTDYSDTDPDAVFEEVCESVYRMKLFQPAFCDLFLEFLDWVDSWLQQEGVDLAPPNSMHSRGLVLAHVGLQQALDVLMMLVVQPLADAYFPWLSFGVQGTADVGVTSAQGSVCAASDCVRSSCHPAAHPDNHAHKHTHERVHGGCFATEPDTEPALEHRELDSAYGFIAAYSHGMQARPNTDRLSLHVDHSHLTLNLCLGGNFLGGDLHLAGHRCPAHQAVDIAAPAANSVEQAALAQVTGVAYLHMGNLRHAAAPLAKGQRRNFILWCRSGAYDSALQRGSVRLPCAQCDLIDGLIDVGEDTQLDTGVQH